MAKPFDLGDIGNIMEQAQAMQSKIADLQSEVGSKTVEASAGGGMVTAKVNGKLEVVGLLVDPEILKDGDREMLQDLVMAAVNEGIRKAQALMTEEMSRLTGGLKIPGLG
ncbi:MAG: YbaB/EbfC family nucleoid-associated protein [Candidatus Binatia bacterium]|nr:YbaB/EbfC family nucleoid-associated protein [Candidatus Binatia bacterium]